MNMCKFVQILSLENKIDVHFQFIIITKGMNIIRFSLIFLNIAEFLIVY